MTAQECAVEIPVGRRPGHRTEDPMHEFCHNCRICKGCAALLLESEISRALKAAYRRGFEKCRERAAARLHDLGEEKYPKAVFQDTAGTHARHLLQNVLPEEIRALQPTEE